MAGAKLFRLRHTLTLFLVVLITSELVSQVRSQTCVKKMSCACEMDDKSGYIDLTSVQSSGKPRFKDVTPTDFGPWLYSWNPCESFSMSQCSNVAACQVSSTDTTQSFDIGIQDSVTFNKDVNDNWVLTYTSRDGTKTLNVVLECTQNSDDLTVTGEVSTNAYQFTLVSRHSCVKQGPWPGLAASISFGSVLCIIFFPGIFLYCAGGVAFNKLARGKSGRDLVPNVYFWSELPGTIKDGYRFATSPCRGATAGDTNYDKI
ncbi:uncharacterized protein LOC118423991 [Branchiostoma floridae]|uniref:Autophagy-related protein 27 n=1 Tax=Branchiostoma floridae TaxID=7739 RepID=A0A9J7LU83_BRAFL|nr:uncharacterized protein LOC118423991 [Branchiostoma floridae]